MAGELGNLGYLPSRHVNKVVKAITPPWTLAHYVLSEFRFEFQEQGEILILDRTFQLGFSLR